MNGGKVNAAVRRESSITPLLLLGLLVAVVYEGERIRETLADQGDQFRERMAKELADSLRLRHLLGRAK